MTNTVGSRASRENCAILDNAMTDKQLADQIRASSTKLCEDLDAAGEAGLTVTINFEPLVLTRARHEAAALRKEWRATISVTRIAHF